MSIFSRSVAGVSTADLQQLLNDGAVENVRLEFKREAPTKDEILKKVSSFANTFGGLIVVGAEAENDGRLRALRGIPIQPSYKQTIVQWCTSGAMPPITVEVSDPIPSPEGGTQVCYVIAVAESEQAPHFLNGRKGVYIRTDEFSSKFEPRLATEQELRFLFDRRRTIENRREYIVNRANERFEYIRTQFLAADTTSGAQTLPPYMTVSIVPRYPSYPFVDQAGLLRSVRNTRLPWRQVGFPCNSDVICQHESVLMNNPDGGLSLLETNIWGMLAYATAIAEKREQYSGIHVSYFIGRLLAFLHYAAKIIREIGIYAPLHIMVSLREVRGVSWVSFPDGFARYGPSSLIDNAVTFSVDTSAEQLLNVPDDAAKSILRRVFFALNWPDVASDDNVLTSFVASGWKFNGWRSSQPSTLSHH